MTENNLITLLKSFSKGEIKEFDKFLRSPYFTEGKNIRSKILYDYFCLLKNYYPKFLNENLTNEAMFEKLYQGKKYNDVLMRRLNSDLTKLTERFLSQVEFEKNEVKVRASLLQQVSDRKLEKHFIKKFNEMLNFLSKLEKDEDYFFETYNTWKNYWNFNFSSKNVYKLEDSIKNVNSYFNYATLVSLRIYLWALSVSNMINLKNEMYLFDEILRHVKNNYKRYYEIPQILFYYNLIMLMTNKDERFFEELKHLKERYYNILSSLDKFNMFIMMANYCNEMIFDGKFIYRKERFILDNECFSNGLFEVAGGIHIFQFISAAKNAIKLGEYSWTEKICSDFIDRVVPSDKEFCINYVKADICLAKKKYELALQYLSKLNPEHSNTKQYIRNLMISIYYEMNEDNAVLSLVDTSKHFIHNDKYISSLIKERFLNFVKLTEQLIKTRENPEQYPVFQLIKKLNASLNVQDKDWLLEKINEIK